MAMQAGNSVAPCTPQVIGSAFVQQYYNMLYRSPEHVHKFYHDGSFLGRPDSNGTMTCVTTMPAIHEQILSTDFASCLIELENVDTQLSHKGGVLILVSGSFTSADSVKQRFTQSFFLAPQDNGGYFVLNDVLRYIMERPSIDMNENLVIHVNEDSPIATYLAEPDQKLPSVENVSINDDSQLPSVENVFFNGEVIDPSAIDTSPQESNVVEASVEVVSEEAEIIPEAAPAPPASAQKDVTKRSYASIVKDMKEGAPPAPIAKSKPKPKPTVKGVENVKKFLPLPAKPAQAADSTSPSDKNVTVELGFSVYVKNLPFNATVEMVDEAFRKFGAIKPGGIQVIPRQFDGFCFGFVEFESQQSMQSAIEASPVRIGSKDSYVEGKRTRTRVVNGVVTYGDHNDNVRGNRFQLGRGGYPDNNLRGQGAGFVNSGNYRDGDNFRGRGAGPVNNGNYHDGDNFRGRGAGPMNNGNYHDGDNFRGRGAGPANNGNYHDGDNFRGWGAGAVNNGNYHDGDNFRGRGAGPANNGNYHDGDNFRGRGAVSMNNGKHRDGDNMRNEYRNRNEYPGRSREPQGNGYHQSSNSYHQNGNSYRQTDNRHQHNMNGYQQNENGHQHNLHGYRQNENSHRQYENGHQHNPNGYRQNENGHQHNTDVYRQKENGHYQNGNGYHEPRPFHRGNGNGRPARFNGPRQTPVAAG